MINSVQSQSNAANSAADSGSRFSSVLVTEQQSSGGPRVSSVTRASFSTTATGNGPPVTTGTVIGNPDSVTASANGVALDPSSFVTGATGAAGAPDTAGDADGGAEAPATIVTDSELADGEALVVSSDNAPAAAPAAPAAAPAAPAAPAATDAAAAAAPAAPAAPAPAAPAASDAAAADAPAEETAAPSGGGSAFVSATDDGSGPVVDSGSTIDSASGAVNGEAVDIPGATGPAPTGPTIDPDGDTNVTSVDAAVVADGDGPPVVSGTGSGDPDNASVTVDGEEVAVEDAVDFTPTAPAPAPGQLSSEGVTQSNSFVLGTEGDDLLVSGPDTSTSLRGNGGDDLLVGAAGQRDRFNGGEGVDTFEIGEGGGRDVISDFDAEGGEVVNLNVNGINSLQDLLNTVTRDQGRVLFDFGDGNTLDLRSVSTDDLSAENFNFNAAASA